MRLPKRYIQAGGQLIEMKEDPDIAEKYDGIDIRWLLEHFGKDKKAARDYVREKTGGNVIMVFLFVQQAYRSLGRWYDDSLPIRCTEGFWGRIKDTACDDSLKHSPLLRMLEILMEENEKSFCISDARTQKCWMNMKDDMDGVYWKCYKQLGRNLLYDSVESYEKFIYEPHIDESSITDQALFAITDKYCYLLGECKDDEREPLYYDHCFPVEKIREIRFERWGDDLHLYLKPYQYEDANTIAVALRYSDNIERNIMEAGLEGRNLERINKSPATDSSFETFDGFHSHYWAIDISDKQKSKINTDFMWWCR